MERISIHVGLFENLSYTKSFVFILLILTTQKVQKISPLNLYEMTGKTFFTSTPI